MNPPSFIDIIFRSFNPANWKNGISIYQFGNILHFQNFGNLFSASIKSGIGEKNEVRIKFQAQGNFVQWMECTCQANRKNGEKCPHLAAFCLYLNQEKQQLLEKIHVPTTPSEQYLSSLYEKLDLHKENNIPLNTQPIKKSTILEKKIISEVHNFESIFVSKNVEILKIERDSEDPWINVSVAIDNLRKVTYRFSVDDTCKILFNPEYRKKASRDVSHLLEHHITAKRFFDVKMDEKQNLVLQKAFYLFKDKKKVGKIFVSELKPSYEGRYGIFIKNTGFVPFVDDMSLVQLIRWSEYSKSATITGDQAAELIENEFAHLKETAHVSLEKNVEDIKIYDRLNIPEYSIKKLLDNSLLIDLKFNHENNAKQHSTILDILKARASGKKFFQTENGFIKITHDFDWLKNSVQKDGQIKLSTTEFIRFYNQLDDNASASGQIEILEKIKQGLVSRSNLKFPSLKGTNLDLRPYQIEGVKWLWWLYQNRLGGLLADEMGLGKTHQAMALIAAISKGKSNSLTLVVCPTSVIDHWLDKIQKYTPNINSICYHGSSRKEFLNQIDNKKSNVLITSYGILLRDTDFLIKKNWNLVILDEAHLVKNQSTRTYKAACKLKSDMRLCLTGTPLENDLLELKNLFDYIAPNYLGSDVEFKKKYMSEDDPQSDPMAGMELSKLIHPFKMRRSKAEVLTDLPEKVEDIRHCHLNTKQAKLYNETLLLKGAKLIDELQNDKSPVPYIHIFSLISLLKQICNDPGLIDPQYDNIGSGKLALFDELLAEALESNQKVVVFSQYAKMVHRLSERLSKKEIKHVVLTGQSLKRGGIIKEFQENPNVQVFLGSLLAGGTGIDLTAANVVIHFDRWWNAAKEDQATGRIHRIGQIRNVQVYKLVTKGTLEERIDEIIAKKKILFERFVEQDEQIFKNLSREDLLKLLEISNQQQDMDPIDL